MAPGWSTSTCSIRDLSGLHVPSMAQSKRSLIVSATLTVMPLTSSYFSTLRWNKLSSISFSEAHAWCTHASISPMYRNGSGAWSSIGRGVPPGPPFVSAFRKALATASCRADAIWSKIVLSEVRRLLCVQYYQTTHWNKTGRSINALSALVISELTSMLSPPNDVLLSYWVHLYSLSYAFSWYSAIDSMISRLEKCEDHCACQLGQVLPSCLVFCCQ